MRPRSRSVGFRSTSADITKPCVVTERLVEPWDMGLSYKGVPFYGTRDVRTRDVIYARDMQQLEEEVAWETRTKELGRRPNW